MKQGPKRFFKINIMKPLYSILFCLLVVFFCSCQGSTSNSEKEKAVVVEILDGLISKDRFAELLSSTSNPQLIDVRTLDECGAGQIEGALNIDFYNDDFSSQLTVLDKSRPVFVYCKSGGRSGKTYKMLKDMGVEKVYDLKGGYDGWK